MENIEKRQPDTSGAATRYTTRLLLHSVARNAGAGQWKFQAAWARGQNESEANSFGNALRRIRRPRKVNRFQPQSKQIENGDSGSSHSDREARNHTRWERWTERMESGS